MRGSFGSRRGAAALARATALCALAAASGCEFDRTAVPAGREQVVVHAVINPLATEANVLVERTLTGRVDVDEDTPLDPLDPIVTGEGVPVRDANVVIESLETGDTAYAVEVASSSPDGRGQGVYRVVNGAERQPTMAHPEPFPDTQLLLTRAGRYELRISTIYGTATAEVIVPDVTPIRPRPTLDTLNADRDTLAFEWREAAGARHYALRAESPFGPFFFFTDSLTFTLTGELRNLFAEDLPKVFLPGFMQRVQIAAVDDNFYDYYRSTNSPFTGSGIINHINGGIGLFGAYMPLETRTVIVTGDDDLPVEGTYVPVEGTSGAPFADTLRLFVYDRTRDGSAVSGYFRRLGAGFDRYQVLGSLTGASLAIVGTSQLASAFRRVSVIGTFAGESIVIAEQPGVDARTVFRKVPATRQ